MNDEHGTSYDHLDHAQLMEAMYNVRREATKVVDQARSILDALLIHNQDPDAHIDLRNTIAQLTISLDEGLTSHDSGENSHPFLLNRILELENLIQKLRDDMGPAINQAIMTHNLDPEAHPHIQQYVKDYNDAHNADPDAHGAAFDKHNQDENAHANIITEIIDYIKNHDSDENAHKVLFEYLEKADMFRYSRIGEVMPGHLMGNYGAECIIPADGRIININLFPELKTKIESGHLFTRTSYSTSYPGIWSKYDDNGNYRAPNWNGRTMKFTTNASNSGLAEADGMYSGFSGSFSFKPTSIRTSSASGVFKVTSTGNNYNGGMDRSASPTLTYNMSLSNAGMPVASEVRVKSILQLPIIYLGHRD